MRPQFEPMCGEKENISVDFTDNSRGHDDHIALC